MSEARAHLDGGALAPERQARADGQDSAEEFHRDQEKRGRRKLPTQNGFDVRDAASRRVRRKAANQPSGERSRCGARNEDDQETHGFPAVSPSNQRIAKTVRLNEGEAESRSDKPCKRAGDERKQREG
jgi:hypothetical protein